MSGVVVVVTLAAEVPKWTVEGALQPESSLSSAWMAPCQLWSPTHTAKVQESWRVLA